jgi:hypothetical protein
MKIKYRPSKDNRTRAVSKHSKRAYMTANLQLIQKYKNFHRIQLELLQIEKATTALKYHATTEQEP